MNGPCVICGQPFQARRSTRRYCSSRCRVRALRSHSVTAPASAGLWDGQLSVGTPAPPPIPLSGVTPAASAPPRPAHRPPRGNLEATASAIATPVDAFGPARAYCELRDGRHGVVFGLDGGRLNEPAGPTFERPRDAIRLADLLNERIRPGAPA